MLMNSSAISRQENKNNYQNIITPTTLADNLYKANWLILDCRGQLLNDNKAYKTFMQQHIPNAYYCCSNGYGIEGLMSKLYSSSLSELENIIEELQGIGFTPNTQIILYEELNSTLTNSLWLKLRTIGIANVAVLQGGFTTWKAKGLPISDGYQEFKYEDQITIHH